VIAVSKGASDLFARFAEPKQRCAKSKNSNSPFLQPNEFKFYQLRLIRIWQDSLKMFSKMPG